MTIFLRVIMLLLAISLTSCLGPNSRLEQSKQSQVKLLKEELPRLILAAATSSRLAVAQVELKELGEQVLPAQDEFNRLLDQISDCWDENCINEHDLNLGFLVQNQYPGQRYGIPQDKRHSDEYQWKGRIFVTEPIEQFRDRSLVIISQFSPARTWIFAVGSDLKPAIIYDYINKTTPPLEVNIKTEGDVKNSYDQLYISIVEEVIYEGPGKYRIIDLDRRYELLQEIELNAKDDSISLVVAKQRWPQKRDSED